MQISVALLDDFSKDLATKCPSASNDDCWKSLFVDTIEMNMADDAEDVNGGDESGGGGGVVEVVVHDPPPPSLAAGALAPLPHDSDHAYYRRSGMTDHMTHVSGLPTSITTTRNRRRPRWGEWNDWIDLEAPTMK